MAAVPMIARLEMTTPKEESAGQLLHPASSEAADDDSSVMSCEKDTCHLIKVAPVRMSPGR